MFGVNYKYQIDESKGTIKLAPTKGNMIASAVIIFLYVGGSLVARAYVEKELEKTENEYRFNLN